MCASTYLKQKQQKHSILEWLPIGLLGLLYRALIPRIYMCTRVREWTTMIWSSGSQTITSPSSICILRPLTDIETLNKNMHMCNSQPTTLIYVFPAIFENEKTGTFFQ